MTVYEYDRLYIKSIPFFEKQMKELEDIKYCLEKGHRISLDLLSVCISEKKYIILDYILKTQDLNNLYIRSASLDTLLYRIGEDTDKICFILWLLKEYGFDLYRDDNYILHYYVGPYNVNFDVVKYLVLELGCKLNLKRLNYQRTNYVYSQDVDEVLNWLDDYEFHILNHILEK